MVLLISDSRLAKMRRIIRIYGDCNGMANFVIVVFSSSMSWGRAWLLACFGVAYGTEIISRDHLDIPFIHFVGVYFCHSFALKFKKDSIRKCFVSSIIIL